MKKRYLMLMVSSVLALSSWSAFALGADIPTVEVAAFSPPSVGSFLGPIISEKKTDEKNGIKIKWVLKPSGPYNTGYASGEFKVGSSAALLSEALRRDKGMKTVFLFGTFDYFGTVIVRDPAIKTLKDLEGHSMAAAKVTTNYAMFMYFAKKEGVDLNKVNVLSASIPALLTYITAGRVDAVQLWEPAYTQIMVEQPGKYHPILYHRSLEKYSGLKEAPYLGVAAHEDWVQQNKSLVPKLYNAFKDAEKWVWANQSEAARIIAETNKLPLKAIEELLKDNDRLGLRVVMAEEIERAIFEIFKMGEEIGYIKKLPDRGIIYRAAK
jgi:NitT/TauT family transport system substrate-binding protein